MSKKSDKPIVPTHQQMRDWCAFNGVDCDAPFFPYVFQAISDWQRGMFPAPKPEVIKRCSTCNEQIWQHDSGIWSHFEVYPDHCAVPEKGNFTWEQACEVNRRISEAYCRKLFTETAEEK